MNPKTGDVEWKGMKTGDFSVLLGGMRRFLVELSRCGGFSRRDCSRIQPLGSDQPGGRRFLLPGWILDPSPPTHRLSEVLRTSWYGTMDPHRQHSRNERGFYPQAMWSKRSLRVGSKVSGLGGRGGVGAETCPDPRHQTRLSVIEETVVLLRGGMKAAPGLFCSPPGIWMDLFSLVKYGAENVIHVLLFKLCTYLYSPRPT